MNADLLRNARKNARASFRVLALFAAIFGGVMCHDGNRAAPGAGGAS